MKFLKFVLIGLVLVVSTVSHADGVWIDVRSAAEHKMDNISGDVRIGHTEIVNGVSKLYPNKDTKINLYCRSGNRAGKALSALKAAGYNNVFNEGGIADARIKRGLK